MIGWETCVSALTSSKTKVQLTKSRRLIKTRLDRALYWTRKKKRLLSTIMLFHGTVSCVACGFEKKWRAVQTRCEMRVCSIISL